MKKPIKFDILYEISSSRCGARVVTGLKESIGLHKQGSRPRGKQRILLLLLHLRWAVAMHRTDPENEFGWPWACRELKRMSFLDPSLHFKTSTDSTPPRGSARRYLVGASLQWSWPVHYHHKREEMTRTGYEWVSIPQYRFWLYSLTLRHSFL